MGNLAWLLLALPKLLQRGRREDRVSKSSFAAAKDRLAGQLAGMRAAMKATIYHNPKCGTSRKTLEILENEGVDVTVVEYLKTPPSEEELRRLYDRAGIKPSEGLRAKEQLAEDLDLLSGRMSEEAILRAMTENPILINRPLVETGKGVRLCRPQEVVREIL
jgi:arsenate reductase (glutaredoxin)